MAKKTVENKGPEVSSLPIKEDQSPLVIDLPDGQKLVVGHLTNGSVIEVATWRGTGRPDSRTSRLMLGMSSATEAAEQAKSEQAAKAEAKKNYPAIALEILNRALTAAKAIKLPAREKKSKSTPEEASSTPFIQKVPAPNSSKSVDTDIDEWLNNLIAKSEEKVSKSASVETPKSKPKAVAKTKKSTGTKSVRKAAPKSAPRRSR
jgi:hypothetical protein